MNGSSSTTAALLNADVIPLFRELGDLKRTTSARYTSSNATRLFVRAMADLTTGIAPQTVMKTTLAMALVATRLGDLGLAEFCALGLAKVDALDIARRAFDDASSVLPSRMRSELRDGLQRAAILAVVDEAAPQACVIALTSQPRAGVTCPGRPRLLLQPQENHAEHSVMVAIYGACAAHGFGADPSTVFLAGLGHHLHNATMPDTGYAGEMVIGGHLDALVAHARADAMGQLPRPVAAMLTEALAQIEHIDSPVAQAFHAADVIDRVLEIEQHFKLKSVTMENVLDDYGLVHAGPVKAFHDAVLAAVGLDFRGLATGRPAA